jgi:hypothetical protein
MHGEFSSRIPAIGGDRKYRGAYLRGEPQNTNRPHEVVPNTKYAVSGQDAPSTTPPAMPGTHVGSLHWLGVAPATDGVSIPATKSPTTIARVERTHATVAWRTSTAIAMPTRWEIPSHISINVGQ